eukprot:g6236.t1
MQSIFPSLALLVLSLSVAESYCCHPSEDESSDESYAESSTYTYYTTQPSPSPSPYSGWDDEEDEDANAAPAIIFIVILLLSVCGLTYYCRERQRRFREAEAIMYQRPTVGSINQHFISTVAIPGYPPYNTTATFPRTVYTPYIPPTHTRTGPTFTPSTSTQYQPPIVPSRRETTPVVETNNERQLQPQQTAVIVDPEGNVQVGIQDER